MGRYIVPGMKLIPQQMTMSCWYASAQMLVHWRQEQAHACLSGLIDPALDAQCRLIRDTDSGITNPQILPMARRIGLKEVPPMSPTPETMEDWLRHYGPLWVNGKSHIVVIAGIDTGKVEVLVYDPAPLNTGRVEWRSLVTWYAFGSSVSTRDTGAGVEAVFLYVPI